MTTDSFKTLPWDKAHFAASIKAWAETRARHGDGGAPNMASEGAQVDLAGHLWGNMSVAEDARVRGLVEAARYMEQNWNSPYDVVRAQARLEVNNALAPFKVPQPSHGFPGCNCRIVAVDPAVEGSSSNSVRQWRCVRCGEPVEEWNAICGCERREMENSPFVKFNQALWEFWHLTVERHITKLLGWLNRRPKGLCPDCSGRGEWCSNQGCPGDGGSFQMLRESGHYHENKCMTCNGTGRAKR